MTRLSGRMESSARAASNAARTPCVFTKSVKNFPRASHALLFSNEKRALRNSNDSLVSEVSVRDQRGDGEIRRQIKQTLRNPSRRANTGRRALIKAYVPVIGKKARYLSKRKKKENSPHERASTITRLTVAASRRIRPRCSVPWRKLILTC